MSASHPLKHTLDSIAPLRTSADPAALPVASMLLAAAPLAVPATSPPSLAALPLVELFNGVGWLLLL